MPNSAPIFQPPARKSSRACAKLSANSTARSGFWIWAVAMANWRGLWPKPGSTEPISAWISACLCSRTPPPSPGLFRSNSAPWIYPPRIGIVHSSLNNIRSSPPSPSFTTCRAWPCAASFSEKSAACSPPVGASSTRTGSF